MVLKHKLYIGEGFFIPVKHATEFYKLLKKCIDEIKDDREKEEKEDKYKNVASLAGWSVEDVKKFEKSLQDSLDYEKFLYDNFEPEINPIVYFTKIEVEALLHGVEFAYSLLVEKYYYSHEHISRMLNYMNVDIDIKKFIQEHGRFGKIEYHYIF